MNENKFENFFKYEDKNLNKIYYIYFRISQNQQNSFCLSILFQKNNISYECYKITFLLESFNQYIKFKTYKDVYSIIKELSDLISKGRIKIRKKDEKELQIQFCMEGNHIFPFNLDFFSELMNIDLDNVEDIIKKLEKDVDNCVNKSNSVEKRYESLDNKLFKLEQSTKEILKMIKNENKENNNIISNFNINDTLVKNVNINDNLVKNNNMNDNLVKNINMNENLVKNINMNDNLFKNTNLNDNLVKNVNMNDNLFKNTNSNDNLFKNTNMNEKLQKNTNTGNNITNTHNMNNNLVKNMNLNQNIMNNIDTKNNFYDNENMIENFPGYRNTISYKTMKNPYDEDIISNDKNIINPFQRNTLSKNDNIKNPFLKTEKTENPKLKHQNSEKLYYNIPTPFPNEEEEIYKLLGIHSGIIKSKKEVQTISKWLSKEKAIKLQLKYKGSENNYKSDLFHIKCDDIVPTLSLIETSNGNRFGGFTNQTWKGGFEFKRDKSAFIFSLDKLEKYPIKNDHIGEAILCKTNYLICFGKGDILIFDNANKMLNKSSFPYSYGNSNIKKYSLNNGESRFIVKEIEIYHVDFDLNDE